MKKTSVYALSVFFIGILVCTVPVAADSIPPTIVSSYPADNEVHVPITIDQITITFSEPIQWDPATMSVQLSDWYHITVPIGDISVDDNTLIIHAPVSPDPWLENWEWAPAFTGIYDVRVTNVKDMDGNVMDPGSYQVHFYTVPADTTPPCILSTSPPDGAGNIAGNVIITAVMSEKINKCTGSVEMVDGNSNPVALVGVYGYDTQDYTTLAITPVTPLSPGKIYTITIREIEDDYRYKMKTPYSWSFTTTSSTPAPEFPTLVLPAGFIIGLLGFVLYIRKTEK
jgi:methionine-rich copper-binding protein CopC